MGFLGIFGIGSGKSEKKEHREQRRSSEVSVSPFAVIEGKVISAFTRVKQDITLLSSWVKYLRHKDLLNEQRHAKTQRELGVHKTLIEGLKQEAAELKTTVKELQEELKHHQLRIQAENRFVSEPNPNLIRTKSEPKADLKRTYFEHKVVSTLRSRKKDYILKQILELASKESYSTSEIEQIVVGEKELCGRTAFYDYMRELKHKRLTSLSEKGSKRVVMAEKASLEQVR